MNTILAVLFFTITLGITFFVAIFYSVKDSRKHKREYNYIMTTASIKSSERWNKMVMVHNTYADALEPLTIRRFNSKGYRDEIHCFQNVVRDTAYSKKYLDQIENERKQLYAKYHNDIEKIMDAKYDDLYDIDDNYTTIFNNCMSQIVIPNQSLKIVVDEKIFDNNDILEAIRQNEKYDSIKASLNIDQTDYRSKIDHVSQDDLYKHEFERQQREKMSASLRYSILKRDNYRCRICGRSAVDGVQLEVDHIIPVSKGGESIESNLQTLCRDCNRGKADN